VTWELHVPHRSRCDSLVEVGGFARQLEGEDGPAARELAMHAATEFGMKTAGELLDYLESSSPAERRELLDRARTRAGLKDTKSVDEIRRAQAASDAARARGNPMLQTCHAPGCDAVPLTAIGSWAETRARCWFCPTHAHLAQPGDLEDRPPPWRYTECGTIVEAVEWEDDRQAAAAEGRRVELEAQADQRAVEAEQRRRHQRAIAAETRRLLPPGVPG
jgi:hypothetical protein